MNQIPNRSPYGITPGNPIQGFYSTGVCRLLSLALSSVLRANTKNIIVLEPPSTLPPPAMQTPPPRKKGSLFSVVYWGSAGANINRFFFLKDFQMASVFPCVLWNFKKNLYGKGLFLFSSVIYPEVELLYHMVALFSASWGIFILFSILAAQIDSPANSAQEFSFLHILSNIYICLSDKGRFNRVLKIDLFDLSFTTEIVMYRLSR